MTVWERLLGKGAPAGPAVSLAEASPSPAAPDLSGAVSFLTERLAELELALEEQDWLRLSGDSAREFSREGLRRMMALSRLGYLKNPLINRAVTVQSHYVWSRGVQIGASDEGVNAVLQAFLDDPANRAELTSHQARTLKEVELQVTGNLFVALFVNQSTGRVRVRSIPADEVQEIHTDPEDSKTPWFYERAWTTRPAPGERTGRTRRAFYPDWRYRPTSRVATIGDARVEWDSPVFQVKVGGLADMRFGVPETYQALDWARAYKEFLEDWATIVRALSRFAWQVKTKGGAPAVANIKSRFNSTLGAGGGLTPETNPPPTTGAMFIAGDGMALDPVRTAGVTTSAEDGRRLLLMVAAATGLPETFFGDVSVGTLATATSLDRPTEMKISDRQRLWQDVLSDLCAFVVARAIEAPNGPLDGVLTTDDDGNEQVTLAGDADPGITVTFPPVLDHDRQSLIGAIVDGATLKGQQPAGTLDDRTLVRLILNALDVENADEVLELIAPEGGESLLAQARAERAAAAPAFGQQPGQPRPGEGPASEALMVEALRELRERLTEVAG